MHDYEVLAQESIYKGRIFDVCHLTVRLPNGTEAMRDILRHNGAAAVVPVTQDGQLVMVRQYREAAGSLMLEIPAGKLAENEDPLICAGRELEEETGYRAASLRPMTSFYTAVGYSTEIIHLYLAEGLTPGPQHPDEDEWVSVELYPLPELLAMIDDGRITDGKTIMAILYYARMSETREGGDTGEKKDG